MKNELIIGLTLLTLIITACGGQATQLPLNPATPTQIPVQIPSPISTSANTSTNASAAGVGFAKDVLPIFENSCNKCHGVDQMKEGLDMRTYESLMAGSFNGPVIVTGKSADSLLVQQLVNGKMPKRGPKLTPGQIKTISEWIDAGALNN